MKRYKNRSWCKSLNFHFFVLLGTFFLLVFSFLDNFLICILALIFLIYNCQSVIFCMLFSEYSLIVCLLFFLHFILSHLFIGAISYEQKPNPSDWDLFEEDILHPLNLFKIYLKHFTILLSFIILFFILDLFCMGEFYMHLSFNIDPSTIKETLKNSFFAFLNNPFDFIEIVRSVLYSKDIINYELLVNDSIRINIFRMMKIKQAFTLETFCEEEKQIVKLIFNMFYFGLLLILFFMYFVFYLLDKLFVLILYFIYRYLNFVKKK